VHKKKALVIHVPEKQVSQVKGFTSAAVIDER